MSGLDVLDRAPSGHADDERPAPPPWMEPDEPGDAGPPHRFGWALEPSPQQLVTLLVVLAACAFTFKELQPSKLFSTTTPAGGDMGAHVWQAAYLRDHLLPHFRLTG
jgi:hypothetical protein